MYGCYQYHNRIGGDRVGNVALDAEQGTNVTPTHAENTNMSNIVKCLGSLEEDHVRQTAGIWGYAFQIIFQVKSRQWVTSVWIVIECIF